MSNTPRRVIALGFFDGVHLGHGALLRAVAEAADRLEARPCAFTFDRHPGGAITGEQVPLLSTVEGDEKTGVSIIAKALAEPMKQIAANAGIDGSVVLEKVKDSGKTGYGFDAYKEEYCDMISSGIVDPTKVTRSALENAASVSAILLTTEALVADKPQPPAPAAPNPDMGGMY